MSGALATLQEDYFESGSAPHEALGRAARKLLNGGALYLGGGVGIEKLTGAQGVASYSVQRAAGKGEKFEGPLSAVMRGFALAGAGTGVDTPGGTTKVADPAVAARLRELNDSEAENTKQIQRYERRLARTANAPRPLYSPGSIDDDRWEQRRIDELKVEQQQIRTERTKLLASGKVEEAVEAGKPGTNWKQVTPKNRKTVDPLVKHYMKSATPFRDCVRDNRKRFPEGDRAERVCAVVKDMGKHSTKWRAGGKSKAVQERELEQIRTDAVLEAQGRLDAIDRELGAGMAIELAERAGGLGDASLDALGEAAFGDLGTLFVAGEPLGVVWQAMREAFTDTGGAAAAARASLKAQGKSVRPGRGPADRAPGTPSKYEEDKHKRAAAGSRNGGQFVTKGGSGSDVRAVQTRVGAKSDGQFGSKTVQAVKDFQRRHRLVVDGVVGHQTALALAGKMHKARAAKTGALRDSDREALSKLRPSKPKRPTTTGRARGGAVIG